MNWKVHKEDVLNRINNCAISKKSKISSRSELYYNSFLFFFMFVATLLTVIRINVD